ncbi:hypothetical protein LCGC14_1251730, partial [marine sediment metagenome]
LYLWRKSAKLLNISSSGLFCSKIKAMEKMLVVGGAAGTKRTLTATALDNTCLMQ